MGTSSPFASLWLFPILPDRPTALFYSLPLPLDPNPLVPSRGGQTSCSLCTRHSDAFPSLHLPGLQRLDFCLWLCTREMGGGGNGGTVPQAPCAASHLDSGYSVLQERDERQEAFAVIWVLWSVLPTLPPLNNSLAYHTPEMHPHTQKRINGGGVGGRGVCPRGPWGQSLC